LFPSPFGRHRLAEGDAVFPASPSGRLLTSFFNLSLNLPAAGGFVVEAFVLIEFVLINSTNKTFTRKYLKRLILTNITDCKIFKIEYYEKWHQSQG
jgi:hypothetical protein